MSDRWDFYFAHVNGTLASLFVDLGLRPSVPDVDRPWLLWVWVSMRSPREDGLSSSDEAPILHQIEDALTAQVEVGLRGQHVGRITTDGRREFYFYTPAPGDCSSVVARAMEQYVGYAHECGVKEDPAWTQYLDVLYPSPRDNQRIQNRRVVDQLQKEGDSLTRARLVSHWIYFRTSQDRAEFLSAVEPLGFAVASESTADDPKAKNPFGVTLERTDRVDWNGINEVTLQLFDIAHKSAGDYDGWETSVERDA